MQHDMVYTHTHTDESGDQSFAEMLSGQVYQQALNFEMCALSHALGLEKHTLAWFAKIRNGIDVIYTKLKLMSLP